MLVPLLGVLGLPEHAAARSAAVAHVREVRTVWMSELGVSRPAGLAYAAGRGKLLVAGSQGGATTPVLRLGFDEDGHGVMRLPAVGARGTLAFDPSGQRLTAIDGDRLLAVPGRDLGAAHPAPASQPISSIDLRDPIASTFDTRSGTWDVLDGSDLVEVQDPSAGGDSVRTSLTDLPSARLVGVAFNPSDGLTYVAGVGPNMLYALDPSGAVAKTYDLSDLGLVDPTAIVFAPSSDNTDAASALDLFVADAGDAQSLGAITEATLTAAPALAVPTITATLVRTTETSAWSPPSPDPSGVVYLPGSDRLLVADSEVDETTGAGYHGVNLWQTTRAGSVTSTGTTFGYPSHEPTGLGYDAGTKTLFVSDDAKRLVFVVRPGTDGAFGTPDDVVSSVNAGAYGSTDTEDPEFLPSTGHLYFLDGIGTEVYDIDPVDGVFGNGNDVMHHFDVGQFGPTDWEGLSSDPSSGDLLVGARKDKKIFEVTPSGTLVRVIDASGISGMRWLSGLATAPATDDAARTDYWIVDRAVDNGQSPSENDGKMFEVSIGGTTNRAPVVTSPGSKSNAVGDTVSYQIQASDPDGDAITSFGATGLPTGLSVNTSSGLISGTTSAAGTFGVTLSATDSKGATGTASFTWTVTSSGAGLTFGAVADTFIRSDRPTKSFGSKPTIVVDAVPRKDGLLKFTVSGVGGGSVSSATLRLFCTDASPVGGSFYPVTDNTWPENVTWNTAPGYGSTPVASLGAVSSGTWYDIDVTSFVVGDGTYSLRIITSHKNAAAYASKEAGAGTAPQLVLSLAA
ncbi:MAG: CBM96 family carbohydrate-binding protein [Actinomycetota bacterium]